MKLVKRTLVAALSLTLCAAMIVPSFAASFTELQDAINGKTDITEGAITAKTENGVRNVTLNENVEYGGETDKAGIYLNPGAKVTLNLNGYTIDGGYNAETGEGGSGDSLIFVRKEAELVINGGADSEDTERRGTLTGGNAFSEKDPTYRTGGAIHTYGNVTVNNVDITGNRASAHGGAIAAFGNYGATVTLNNTNVTNNTAQYGGGIYSANKKGTCTININNSSVSGNTATQEGGGIFAVDELYGSDGCAVSLNGVALNGNKALNGNGGAMYLFGDDVTLTDTTMTGNTASENGGAIVAANSKIQLNGNIGITGNKAGSEGGGVKLYGGDTLQAGNDSSVVIRGNSATVAGDDIYAAEGDTLNLRDNTWLVDTEESRAAGENEKYTMPEDGKVTGAAALKDGSVMPEAPEIPEVPEVPGNPTNPVTSPVTNPTVEIEDEAVPLAGLFTRADAIGYLWEQAGKPEAELSTFEDVPADHVWAEAIGWAQDVGIAVADQEGNFRPDDLVLRWVEDHEAEPEGELEEFLNRYAEFAGIELDAGELFVELGGEPTDIVMGEDAQVIFDSFFAKLEEALEELAA